MRTNLNPLSCMHAYCNMLARKQVITLRKDTAYNSIALLYKYIADLAVPFDDRALVRSHNFVYQISLGNIFV